MLSPHDHRFYNVTKTRDLKNEEKKTVNKQKPAVTKMSTQITPPPPAVNFERSDQTISSFKEQKALQIKNNSNKNVHSTPPPTTNTQFSLLNEATIIP